MQSVIGLYIMRPSEQLYHEVELPMSKRMLAAIFLFSFPTIVFAGKPPPISRSKSRTWNPIGTGTTTEHYAEA
jgi:hypothetical protein